MSTPDDNQPSLTPEEQQIIDAWGGWTHFMLVFEMRPCDPEHTQAGKRLAATFALEPPFTDGERKIIDSYGGWTDYMQFLELETWDSADVERGKRILAAFAADEETGCGQQDAEGMQLSFRMRGPPVVNGGRIESGDMEIEEGAVPAIGTGGVEMLVDETQERGCKTRMD